MNTSFWLARASTDPEEVEIGENLNFVAARVLESHAVKTPAGMGLLPEQNQKIDSP